MKMKGSALGVGVALLLATASCVETQTQKTLHQRLSEATSIRVGSGFNYSDGSNNEQDKLAITDPVEIKEFARGFSFSSEHDYTVKHALGGYIHLDSATGILASIRFEHRIMRFQNREYYLSTHTARMLEEKLQKK